MSCNPGQGYTKACRDSIGGISKIYLVELTAKSSITSASGVITAFTLNTGKKFWTYEVEVATANANDDPTPNRQNGTLYWEQSISFYIPKRQASLSQEIKVLAQNDLMIIYLDRNGVYWLLGENTGMAMSPSKSPTGTKMEDQNGYLLTFATQEIAPANQVTGSLLTTLTTPA